jgi:4-alpha-glucanotransferase
MKFAPLDRPYTGVALPVSALRTAASVGCGDFADLAALGPWCRETGLDLVQLLPVNDTGSNSSPYSALSAFALHPVYLRVQEVPGAAGHAGEIRSFQAEAAAREAASGGRFSYAPVRAFKLGLVRQLYAEHEKAILGDRDFVLWQADNPWVIAYAVFTALKAQTADAPWSSWGSLAEPGAAAIRAWWDAHPAECLPTAWTQYLLEGQLARASRALQDNGVFLKGDIPILMSVEAADVWSERRFFDLSGTAGAPPDMFSPDGQNWGFPVYDWENLERDDLSWWRARLLQAAKFFHAFRIDHVLGFFRIWRVPRGEITGALGLFSPSRGLSASDLESLGYDEGRQRWLTVPHITGGELASLGALASRTAERYLARIGTQDLYTLRPEADGQQAIAALDEPADVKRFLGERHLDRTFLVESGRWYATWYHEGTKGYRSLGDGERAALNDLLGRRRAESEAAWEERGKRLLSQLQAGTDMLVCAEDLGDVPRCVPRVLGALRILGLRIMRWSRAYDETPAGRPAAFIPPERYAALSVCTPSVHDTSTLRGWWREDAKERAQFWSFLGGEGPAPAEMDPALLLRVMTRACEAASLLCVFQVQDLLDLDPGLWKPDPGDDRINVPGTVNDRNWTWRLPLPVEEIAGRAGLAAAVRGLTVARRTRAGTSAGPGAARGARP